MRDRTPGEEREPLVEPERSAGHEHTHAQVDTGRPFVTYIPAMMVMAVIASMYVAFMLGELVPQIKYDKNTGIAEATVFHVFLVVFLFNYFATMFKNPGEVPHDDAEWKFQLDADGNVLADGPPTGNHEVKADGDRRRCKWCRHYKPDRTHHCRISKKCILKMDHHCPWVNNCIGFYNHKNFVLTTFYGFSCCLIIAVTTMIRIGESPRRETLIGAELAFSVAALIMGVVLFVPLVSLYGFHIWLALKGLTTIEFCEKRSFGAKYRSRYYISPMKNLKAVLGENPLTWFCCWGFPKGDGMHFDHAGSRTQVDLSANKPTTTSRHRDKLADWNRKNRDPELDRGSGAEHSENSSEHAGDIV